MNIFIFLFAAAQGAAIFATAWLLMQMWGASHSFLKIIAMGVSYIGWCLATLLLFAVLGGGGLMEGGFMLIAAFGTALTSSAVYLAIWAIVPLFKSKQHG